MRITIKRISTIICAAVCLLSMTGCLFNPFRRSSSRSTSSKELSYDEAAEILLKEYSVQSYSGSVPDGMEIKYVVVKEVYMDNYENSHEYQYDYDKAGRQTVKIDVNSINSVKYELTYNSDGTLAKKEFSKEKDSKAGNYGPNYYGEYTYNENKQLISYTVSEDNQTPSTYKLTYENGHLKSAEVNGSTQTYDYCTAGVFYDYCAVVSDDFYSSAGIEIVKRTYSDNTFEQVLTETNSDNRVTYFEYDGDTLIGWYWIDEWDRTIKWNANGNLVAEIEKDGTLIEKSEYNEYYDRTLYERYDNGVLVDKATSVFEYDGKGNKLSETCTYWYNRDDREDTFISLTKYDYDNHGLLKSEVNFIDDSFMNMTVYAYKAIAVPVDD